MKRFSQQLHTTAKKHVTLTKAESRELKERLVSYMEYHPLPESMRQPAEKSVLASEPFFVWRFNTIQTRAFASMFVLATLIVVPFAAERAVPGDMLYPVKVSFNEEVRSSLAFSPYQKIEWETERVERRLAEARLLASEGKLTADIEAEVAAAVRTHSSAAQASLAELRETDSDEATIAELAFASALEVESEVLERETKRQAAAGASTTVALAAAIADVRASVAGTEATEISFDRLLARVEEETTRAAELLASLKADVSGEERTDINRRLGDIDRKIVLALETQQTDVATLTLRASSTEEADTPAAMMAASSEVSAEIQAKQYLREALRDTQKLIHFMTDIDVKLNVSVEDLVPVILTPEERLVIVREQLDTLEVLVADIEARNSANEKVVFGLAIITELAEDAEKAFVVRNINEAEQAATEAVSLAQDLLELAGETTVSLPTNTLPATTTTTTTTDVRASSTGSSEPIERILDSVL